MTVDVKIGTVETTMTARDPELLNDPKLIAKIVQMVKQDLMREMEEEKRRDADRNSRRGR